MTTAVTTFRRRDQRAGIGGAARRLFRAVAALSDGLTVWAARYYAAGIAQRFDTIPQSERTDAALRWHARRGRAL